MSFNAATLQDDPPTASQTFTIATLTFSVTPGILSGSAALLAVGLVALRLCARGQAVGTGASREILARPARLEGATSRFEP